MTEVANLNTKLSLESASFISGIEKSRGALRSLIASIDPAAAAQAKFNRETQLLEGAMKRGQITGEAYSRGMEVLRQRLAAATTQHGAIVQSTGNVRAGMQQLSFQLGDIATQWASGTKPMVIFAQQGGQVIQALGMMTNSTKGLLGFLGGPWGQIITAAAVVLTPLISKLFESADAGKAAADGVMTYVDALKKLQDQAGAFKFGSEEFGKINKSYLEAEANVARLRAELSKPLPSGPMVMTPGGTGPMRTERTRGVVQADLLNAIKVRDKIASDLRAEILKKNNRADLDRSAPPAANARGSRSSGRSSGSGSARSIEFFDNQSAYLRQQQLGLLEGITADVREQARLQHERVDVELETYEKDLSHQVAQGLITDEKAKELLTLKQRNSELEKTRINWALDDKLTQQDLELTRARLENSNELKEGELDAARTQDERRRIQLEILENERQMAVATLEAVKARHSTTDVEYQIAQQKLDQLDAEFGQRAASVQRNTMGPMAQYLDSLPRSADELKERFESIKVDALNNGLDLASRNVLKLKGVAGDLFNQLIADVIRLNLQSALAGGGGLLGSLGRLLGMGGSSAGGAGSGAAGLMEVIPGVLGAHGTGASGGMGSIFAGALPKFASGGSFNVGGVPGVDRNLLSVNGIPRAMVSANENISVGYGGGGAAARVEIVEHPGFAARVVGISGNVAIETTRTSNTAAYRRSRQRLG